MSCASGSLENRARRRVCGGCDAKWPPTAHASVSASACRRCGKVGIVPWMASATLATLSPLEALRCILCCVWTCPAKAPVLYADEVCRVLEDAPVRLTEPPKVGEPMRPRLGTETDPEVAGAGQ